VVRQCERDALPSFLPPSSLPAFCLSFRRDRLGLPIGIQEGRCCGSLASMYAEVRLPEVALVLVNRSEEGVEADNENGEKYAV